MNQTNTRQVVQRAILMLAAALCAGCGSTMLLDEEIIRKVDVPPDPEPHVVRCTADLTTMPDGKVQEKRYLVVRVGRTASAFPRELSVEDDANDRVLNVEGRILHADGSSTHIPPSAFYRVNVSDDKTIAEQYVRTAPIRDKLATGDLVETVALLEHTVPQMGIRFSPAALEYATDNVTCTFTTTPAQNLRLEVVNAHITPTELTGPTGTTYTFAWPPYRPLKRGYHEMLQRNPWPMLMAIPASQTWVSFGDWYLDLVKEKLLPGKALADTTRRIITGKTSAREKMDAIFEYCQRTVRYEQMYLEHGEFIPNAADVVLARRFGDCKDYATLMHAMAASVGIQTHMVLCYRGRGSRMFEHIPASQFNHVILHFDDDGRDRWYDATDRLGLSGTPSFDLANARALVIEKGHSRFVTIEESPQNVVRIDGHLTATQDAGLDGVLSVSFTQQYAVEYSWYKEHLNNEKMRALLTRTLKDVLNGDLIIDSLGWSATRDTFTATARCGIPNCVTTLVGTRYIAVSRVFPNLLPGDPEDPELQKAFYFPYYNRVRVDVAVDARGDGRAPFPLQLQYQLPAGPFTDATRPAFLQQLGTAVTGFTRSNALNGDRHP